jgi:ABC-type transport system involved in cytochrome c biogenesis permease subunit
MSTLPILVLLTLAGALFAAEPEAESSDAKLEQMAELLAPMPILHEGRLKPLDTVARHHLMLLTEGQQRLPKTEAMPAGLSARAWFIESLVDRESSSARPSIRVRSFEVTDWLDLPRRTPGDVAEKNLAWRYTPGEIFQALSAHNEEIVEISRRGASSRVEARLLELAHSVNGFIDMLAQEFRFVPGPESERSEWVPPGHFMRQRPDALQDRILRLWLGDRSGEEPGMLGLIQQGDVDGVAEKVASLREAFSDQVNWQRLDREVWYNEANFFVWSNVFYILSLVLVLLSLAVAPRALGISALSLLGLGLVLQTVGIGLRIDIMQRAPVATLYESVIFVGWVTVLTCVLIECFRRRKGLATFVGASLGVILHLVAMGYAADGDTMGMLQAVLNSQFWLTTHVLTIAIGYGLCLVTGLVAHVHLIKVIAQPADSDVGKELARLTVGLALLSLFFTLFGTILGGIWADQSWGRFWGWDPKENGALLIVLWLLLFLHSRLVGLCPLGFAAAMVVLNIVVALAWFGVNQLGIGLHSYGFSDGETQRLLIFGSVELLAALGLYIVAKSRQNAVGGSCELAA